MTVALFLVHVNVMDTNTTAVFQVKTGVSLISDNPDNVPVVSLGDRRSAMTQVGLRLLDSDGA